MARSNIRIGKRRQVIAGISATCFRNCGGTLQSAAGCPGFSGAQPDVEIEIVRARFKGPCDGPDGLDFRALADEDSGTAQAAKGRSVRRQFLNMNDIVPLNMQGGPHVERLIELIKVRILGVLPQ